MILGYTTCIVGYVGILYTEYDKPANFRIQLHDIAIERMFFVVDEVKSERMTKGSIRRYIIVFEMGSISKYDSDLISESNHIITEA